LYDLGGTPETLNPRNIPDAFFHCLLRLRRAGLRARLSRREALGLESNQPVIFQAFQGEQIMTGWWLTYPSEKYESVGMMKFPIYMEK